MARFTRLEVFNTILDIGLVPSFYNGETHTAIEVVSALQARGVALKEPMIQPDLEIVYL